VVSEVQSLPPKPVADRDTEPFWDAVAGHRLVVQRCDSCEAWVWQPRPLCPRCHGESLTWQKIEGAAKVVSWTALHPPVLPVWADKLPFVILLVELDDAPGVRMIGQLVDDEGEVLRTNGEPEGIAMDAPVALRWRVDEGGQTLPAWTLAV
jgi:hypothetical protein